MLNFTKRLPAANGAGQTPTKDSGIDPTDLAHQVLALFAPHQGAPGIKIDKIEIHFEESVHNEHKYFIHPETSAKHGYEPTAKADYVPHMLGTVGEAEEREAETVDLRDWRAEVEAFERMHAQLLEDEKLRNQFVAIHGGNVVDHDTNELELAKRMYRRFPGRVVLIEQVDVCDHIIDMPTPEPG